jgi:hypothetical protein
VHRAADQFAVIMPAAGVGAKKAGGMVAEEAKAEVRTLAAA